MTTDDSSLLRAYAQDGSQAAFTELVRRHLSLVYHAALRQTGGDRHRAEDVAQLVFADLARKAASLAGRATLVAWLHTSTRYAAIQAVRSECRRQAREQQAFAMQTPPRTDEPETDWATITPWIDDALRLLGERDRTAVLLRFFQGCSFAEIGARLALSEDAARVRVARALDKIRTTLARRGLVSTHAALAAALAGQASATVPAQLVAQVSAASLAQVATASAGGLLAAGGALKIASGFAAAIVIGGLGFAVLGSARKNISSTDAQHVAGPHASSRIPAAEPPAARANSAASVISPVSHVGQNSTSVTDALAQLARPDTYKEFREEAVRMLSRTHAEVLARLDLGEARETRLKYLLADRLLESFESVGLAAQGETSAPTVLAAFDQGVGDADERIRAFLGDETYARFDALESTIPFRNQLRAAALRLAGTPHALTPERIDAYCLTMRERWTDSLTNEVMLDVARLLPFRAAVIDETSLAVAQAILDPVQFAAFRELHDAGQNPPPSAAPSRRP